MRSPAAPLFLIAFLITASACDPASPDDHLAVFELEPRSWRMTPGETRGVTVTGWSNPSSLTWISSDEKVATVDPDGGVVAVAPGSARITARSEEAEGFMEVDVLEPPTSCDASLNTRHGASMPDDARWRVALELFPDTEKLRPCLAPLIGPAWTVWRAARSLSQSPPGAASKRESRRREGGARWTTIPAPRPPAVQPPGSSGCESTQ